MKIKLILSVFCLLWILFMFFANRFHWDIGVLGGALWEMLTIPVFLLIGIQLVVYGIFIFKEKFRNKETVFALLINMISVIIIVFSSINYP